MSQKMELRAATHDLRNSINFIAGNIKGCKTRQLSLDDESYGKGDIYECIPYPDGTIGSRCPNDKLIVQEKQKHRKKKRKHPIGRI